MQIFPFRCKLDRLLEAKAQLGCFCTRQIVCESLQNLRLSVLIFWIPQARNLGWSLYCSVFWFSVCLSWILQFYILWILLYVCFLFLYCLAQRQRYLPEKSSPDLLFNILSFTILIDSSKVRGPTCKWFQGWSWTVKAEVKTVYFKMVKFQMSVTLH